MENLHDEELGLREEVQEVHQRQGHRINPKKWLICIFMIATLCNVYIFYLRIQTEEEEVWDDLSTDVSLLTPP